jgi:anti-sigma B factor antagonist
MSIEFVDVSDDFRRITLSGRLDIQGTAEISPRFSVLASAQKKQVVVDLTQVDFLASIGIRELIVNAKAQLLRGGRMVLQVKDSSTVAKTLEVTNIAELLPMFTTQAEADQAAQA